MIVALLQLSALLIFLLSIRIWQRQVRQRRQRHYIIERNVYLLVIPIVGIILLPSYFRGEWVWLIAYVLFCIAGILNEAWTGLWWHYVVGKRLWTYYFDPIFSQYASHLGLLPWGIGGFLFLKIASLIQPILIQDTRFFGLFLVWACGLLALQIILLPLVDKGRNLTPGRIVIFFFPTIAVALVFSIIYGHLALLAVVIAASILVALEYLFGRYIQTYMGQPLWNYHVWAHAKGHFSFVTLPLAIYSGFLAIALFQGVNLVLNLL